LKEKKYTFIAPTSLMDEFEKVAKAAGYNSRSHAIRAAIRKHIEYMEARRRTK